MANLQYGACPLCVASALYDGAQFVYCERCKAGTKPSPQCVKLRARLETQEAQVAEDAKYTTWLEEGISYYAPLGCGELGEGRWWAYLTDYGKPSCDWACARGDNAGVALQALYAKVKNIA